MKRLTNLDMTKNEIQNAVVQKLASDPSSPVVGQTYFNTGSNKLRTYNGATWDEYGTSTASGDVVGPASSVDSEVVLFNGTSGKSVKRATGSGIAKLTSGVLSTATAGTDYVAATTGSAIQKGNGSGGLTAATAGTDYTAGTSALATGILKNTTTTGAHTIAVAGDFPTLNQNTTGTAANVTGTVAVANGGTGRATSTTAYGLIAAGTTATGVHQTLPAGATTDLLVGGGASALPVWTAATGTGSPVRATSPTLVTPVLGTPTSVTLTNATGLPVSGITASTSAALGVGTVELGHATDTTLSRSVAGRLAVEGVNVVTTSSTDTLTNKTFDANGTGNSLSNVEVADFAAAAVVTAAEGIGSNDNDTTIPTSAAVKAYADTLVGAADAMVYKGAIDASLNPNYPAAVTGDTYKISVGGKVGGASGVTVTAGDMVIASADNAGGTQASVGASWNVIQANLDTATDAAQGIVELATVAESEAKTDTTRAVTPAGLASFTRKFVGTIGNGSLTALPVTHGLGSQYVTAQVFDATSNEMVECDVVLTSSTVTTFNFVTAPTSNQYRVVIVG